VQPAHPDRTGDAALVTVSVPTAEAPQYAIDIGDLTGGRRLLSDDVATLEAVANLVARRIDAVRVSHQRYAHDLREQEISKLATEAELRAIRAQINPHFLFNALTTIGYLIQTSPERAFDTLMRLTGLLRAVLKRSEGDFSTLGEEIDLVESYLAIERARLEERLDVRIDVPEELRGIRIPMLVVQPLVENAIKHGIAPAKAGGEVSVQARLEGTADGTDQMVRLTVADTGLGVSEAVLEAGRVRGIGLASIQRRLAGHFGDGAGLTIESVPGSGTTVEVRLPVTGVERVREPGPAVAARGDR
ncbi:MAG: histidine kinase, partial [Blastocatellia bacterium]